jgi:hypothetical protein
MLLEATVRAEEGIFHLTVPISDDGGEGGEDDEDLGEEEEQQQQEEDDDDDEGPALQVTVALSVSEDGATLFATRRLCGLDDSLDLEGLLRAVSSSIHVQLSIDEDDDLVLGSAAPIGADPEWLADMVGEIAEFAPEIAEDAAPIDEAQ